MKLLTMSQKEEYEMLTPFSFYIYIYIYIYFNSIWLSLSPLGLWQTKCGIIWRALNIYDRAII